MKQALKKLLALLMVAMMLCSCMPLDALAEAAGEAESLSGTTKTSQGVQGISLPGAPGINLMSISGPNQVKVGQTIKLTSDYWLSRGWSMDHPDDGYVDIAWDNNTCSVTGKKATPPGTRIKITNEYNYFGWKTEHYYITVIPSAAIFKFNLENANVETAAGLSGYTMPTLTRGPAGSGYIYSGSGFTKKVGVTFVVTANPGYIITTAYFAYDDGSVPPTANAPASNGTISFPYNSNEDFIEYHITHTVKAKKPEPKITITPVDSSQEAVEGEAYPLTVTLWPDASGVFETFEKTVDDNVTVTIGETPYTVKMTDNNDGTWSATLNYIVNGKNVGPDGSITVTANASVDYTGRVEVTVGSTSAGAFTSTADDVPCEASTTFKLDEPAIKITKTITSPTGDNALVGVGDTINYSITVENTGNVNLKTVTVSDSLVELPPEQAQLSNLAHGKSVELTGITYTVTEDDVKAGKVSNTATVTGTTTYGAAVTATSDPATINTARDIPVTKTWVDPAPAPAHDDVTVNLYANGVTTGDPLTLNDGNSWSGTFEDLPVLDAAGDLINYTIAEDGVNPDGTVTNNGNKYTANVSGFTITNTRQDVDPVPPKKKVVSPTTGTVGPRENITYEIEYFNHKATPQTITITDPLPDCVRSPIVKKDGANVSGVTVRGNTISWSFEAKPFERGTYTVIVTVDAAPYYTGTMPESIDNTATVQIGEKEYTSTTATIKPKKAKLQIEKTVDKDEATFGDTVEYTFTVTNIGDEPLTGITVGDARIGLDASAEFDLQPGANQVVKAKYTLQASDGIGTFINTAEVTGFFDTSVSVRAVSNNATVNVKPYDKEITITADSGTWEYDGNAHSTSGVTWTGLPEGYTVTATTTGSVTNVSDSGSTNVISSYTITDATGTVVTAPEKLFTNIKCVPGTLTITPRAITIQAESATKEYDGNPLTNATATVSAATPLADGDELASVTVTGSQTECGSSNNVASNAKIVNADDTNVTENYAITYTTGTLEVTGKDATDPNITVIPPSNVTYNGNEQQLKPTVMDGTTTLVENVDYTLKYDTPKGDFVQAQTITVKVIFTGNYTGTVEKEYTIRPLPIKLTGSMAEKVYDGTPLSSDDWLYEINDKIKGTVTGSRTTIEYTHDTFIVETEGERTDVGITADGNKIKRPPTITNAKGEDVSASYTIQYLDGCLTVRPRLVTEDKKKQFNVDGLHDVVYNGTEQKLEPTITDTGLAKGATKTQLVENVDYTLKYSEDLTNVGTVHVWVYFNVEKSNYFSYADPIEVTYQITRAPVTVTADNASKVYGAEDPEPFTATVDGLIGSDTIEYSVARDPGENVGKYKITPTGEEKQGNYKVTYVDGTFTITAKDLAGVDIKLSTPANVEYNGKVQEQEPVVTANGETLTEGVDYTLSYEPKNPKNAGDVTVTVTFTNYSGTKETTYKITKKHAFVASGSAKKEYDGTPLTNNTVTYTDFVSGEGVTGTATGSQTLVNTSKNTFTYEPLSGTDLKNYDITEVEGELTVTANNTLTITITAKDAKKTYDGKELTQPDFTVEGLPTGATFKVTASMTEESKRTDAGETDNQIDFSTIEIYDANGNDVTEAFSNLRTAKGTLTINKRKVTLTSEDATKEYDGTPLKNDKVTVDGEGFVKGQGVTCTVTGEQLTVGTSDNKFTYTLNDGTDENNYAIETKYGTLTVTNRKTKYEITVTAKSDTVTYNGEGHTVTGFVEENETGALKFEFNKQEFTVSGLSASASGTNAGTYDSVVTGTPVVKDAMGNVVTDQFKITFEKGTLTINKREIDPNNPGEGGITVSPLENVPYNGTEQTQKPTVMFKGKELVLGTDYTLSYSSDRTNVGTVHVWVYFNPTHSNFSNKNGQPIEVKYEITPVVLSVTAANQTTTYGSPAPDNRVTLSGMVGDDSEITLRGQLGLRYECPYVVGNPVGEYPITLHVANTLRNYTVECVDGTLTVKPREVTLTSGSGSKMYDGTPLTNHEITVGGDGFAEGEGATYTVTGSQTIVGSSDNTFEYTLNKGTDAKNYNITTAFGKLEVTDRPEGQKFEITVRAKSATETYDGGDHEVKGFDSLTFEVGGNTYTVEGLSASVWGMAAGTYDSKVTGTAVVRDAARNDVTSQFKVTTVDGKLTINKCKIILQPKDATKEYDGTALKATEVVFLEGTTLAPNDKLSAWTIEGEQTEAGEGASSIADDSVKITDSVGKDMTGSYEIETRTGSLTITSRNVNDHSTDFTVDANNVVYNGGSQQVKPTVKDGTKTLAEGTDYTLSYDGQNTTDAGTVTVTVNFKGNYEGTLTKTYEITPYELKIMADNKTKTYGDPDPKLTVTVEEMQGDDTCGPNDPAIAYDVTYTLERDPGEEANKDYAIKVTAAEYQGGANKKNYHVVYTDGTLTITPKAYDPNDPAASGITVTKPDDVMYDGSSQQKEPTITDGTKTLVKGTDYELSYSDNTTDAGDVTVTVTFKGNYAGTATTTYEITKRSVTLTSATDSKVYDGTALTNDEITVTGDGFVEGEGATYNVNGSQTIPGSSNNAFTYTLNGNTKADNYTITQEYGTLAVTDRTEKFPITVTANSAAATYDGTQHSVRGLVTDRFTVNGLEFTVEGLSASASGTNVGQYSANVEGTATVRDAEGNDVTAQFAITRVSGTLTIRARAIDPDDPASGVTVGALTDVTYTGAAQTLEPVVTANGVRLTAGVDYSLTYTGDTTNVGEVTVTVTFLRNYSGTATRTYNITPAAVTVTANDAGKVYGEADPESFTATVTGLVGNDTAELIAYSVARTAGEDVGEYDITPSGEPTQGNYSVTYVAGTFTITAKALDPNDPLDPNNPDSEVAVGALTDVTYNGAAQELAPVVTANGETLTAGVDYTLTYAGDTTNPGAVTVTVTFIKNYSGTTTRTYNILPRAITIAANSATKVFDGTPLVDAGYTVDAATPLAEGDAISSVTVTGTQTAIGSSPNVASGAVILNENSEDVTTSYEITYVDGTLTIQPRTFTLTVNYWYGAVGGAVAAPTFTRAYAEGDTFNVASPAIAGYNSNRARVTGTINDNTRFDVIYTAIPYTLTVNYVYEDGTAAADTYTDTLTIGEGYTVPSPAIDGYTPSTAVVEGNMPGRNLTMTVIYVPDTTDILIDEYGVPLNIGNVTTNIGDCFE